MCNPALAVAAISMAASAYQAKRQSDTASTQIEMENASALKTAEAVRSDRDLKINQRRAELRKQRARAQVANSESGLGLDSRSFETADQDMVSKAMKEITLIDTNAARREEAIFSRADVTNAGRDTGDWSATGLQMASTGAGAFSRAGGDFSDPLNKK